MDANPHCFAETVMIAAADVAYALNGRMTGGQWMCCCPAHNDTRPSLAVRDGDHGRVLLKCHAGCDQFDVIDALKSLGLWETSGRTFAPLKPKPTPKPQLDNRAKAAQWLWSQRRPITGSIAQA